jgi:outer membrane protein assembly factor BamB
MKKIALFAVTLIAIFIGTSSVIHAVESSWPMFGHDPQHTGQSPYLAAQSDNLRWVYSLSGGDFMNMSSPAIASDGTLYIGSGNGVNAINSNGTLKWTFPTGYSTPSSPSIGTDGTIYFGSDDGALYAISSNGALKWKYSIGPNYGVSSYVSSPVVSADGTIYILSPGSGFYAVNPNGTLKWSLGGLGGYSSPALAPDGTVYVNSGWLYAINPNGSIRWTYYVDQMWSSPAIAPDGTVYVGGETENSTFYAINPNGTLKWSYDTGFHRPGQTGYASYSHPSIGKDGTIYIGSNDGNLYAIRPDGGLKWKYTFADGTQNLYLFYSSAAIGSDGTVYIGGNDGVYAFNSDGTVKWSYPTGWIYSSPAIGSNETLYIRSGDQLYAFISPTIFVPKLTQAPNPFDFPRASDLFTSNTLNFITDYSNAMSTPSMIYLNDNLGFLDHFLIKTIGGPNWKERFQYLEGASKDIGTALSLTSIVVSMIENPPAGFAKLALFEGKELLLESLNWKDSTAARLGIDGLDLLITTPTGGGKYCLDNKWDGPF